MYPIVSVIHWLCVRLYTCFSHLNFPSLYDGCLCFIVRFSVCFLLSAEPFNVPDINSLTGLTLKCCFPHGDVFILNWNINFNVAKNCDYFECLKGMKCLYAACKHLLTHDYWWDVEILSIFTCFVFRFICFRKWCDKFSNYYCVIQSLLVVC